MQPYHVPCPVFPASRGLEWFLCSVPALAARGSAMALVDFGEVGWQMLWDCRFILNQPKRSQKYVKGLDSWNLLEPLFFLVCDKLWCQKPTPSIWCVSFLMKLMGYLWPNRTFCVLTLAWTWNKCDLVWGTRDAAKEQLINMRLLMEENPKQPPGMYKTM